MREIRKFENDYKPQMTQFECEDARAALG